MAKLTLDDKLAAAHEVGRCLSCTGIHHVEARIRAGHNEHAGTDLDANADGFDPLKEAWDEAADLVAYIALAWALGDRRDVLERIANTASLIMHALEGLQREAANANAGSQ